MFLAGPKFKNPPASKLDRIYDLLTLVSYDVMAKL